MDEKSLIFIFSQPRSGSTFLQSLLSNNSLVNTTSESWLLLALSPLFKPELIREATYDHAMAMDAYGAFCSRLEINKFEQVRQYAISHYEVLGRGYSYVLDKTPRYWEILEEILALFPQSKFIVLRRNPQEVIRSMIQTWNIGDLEGLLYLGRDLCHAPKILSEFASAHQNSENVRSISYHDLARNTTKVVSDLYEWLGLPFEESVLQISENSKILGKYGDPFINGEKRLSATLDPKWNDLISGYLHFLGQDYLGEFELSTDDFRETAAFTNFLNAVSPI